MTEQRVINKQKLLSFSAVLSILVVLIHAENLGFYQLAPGQSPLATFTWGLERFLSGDIAKVGVPAFFMFSGILFYRDFDFSKYPQKMKSRVFSLLIPYLLWNFFRFCLFYLLGKFSVVEDVLHINPVVFTPTRFLEAVFFYKYNLGYWFMYQLILYTLLCPLIYLLLKKKTVAIFALCGLFVLYATDALGELSVTVFHKKFIQIDGLFYYMLGGFFATHYFHAINHKTNRSRPLAVLGLLLGQAFYVLFQHTHILALHLLFCTVSAISLWYFFDYFENKTLPAAITSITFFIYSAHGTVLELFQAVNSVLFPPTALTALLEYILLPAITLVILVGAAKLLKRFTPHLWRLVNGAR